MPTKIKEWPTAGPIANDREPLILGIEIHDDKYTTKFSRNLGAVCRNKLQTELRRAIGITAEISSVFMLYLFAVINFTV
jgi:hypothetical protein